MDGGVWRWEKWMWMWIEMEMEMEMEPLDGSGPENKLILLTSRPRHFLRQVEGPGVWSRPDADAEADLLLDNDGLRLPLRLLFNDQFVGLRLRCVPTAFSARLAGIVLFGLRLLCPRLMSFSKVGVCGRGSPFGPGIRKHPCRLFTYCMTSEISARLCDVEIHRKIIRFTKEGVKSRNFKVF